MKHFFHWMHTLLLYDISTSPIEISSLFLYFSVWASLWLALINRIWQGHEPIPTPSQSFKKLCAFWFFLLNVAETLSKDPDSLLQEERPCEGHESSQLRPSYISQPPPAQQLTSAQENPAKTRTPTQKYPPDSSLQNCGLNEYLKLLTLGVVCYATKANWYKSLFKDFRLRREEREKSSDFLTFSFGGLAV